MSTSKIAGFLVGLLACVLWVGTARSADAYPAKSIRLVVGYPPGGSADFLGRVLGDELGRALGQAIIIDNRPGAGTNIASELVARAAPDGYTLLLGNNSSHGINRALYKKLGFDPERDFIPVTKLTGFPLIICVNRKLGVNTLAEFIAKARKEPGKLNFASSGNGSPNHLAGVMFNTLTGADLVHIPYQGGAPSVQSLLAGDTQVIFGTPPVVLPHIASGKLIALATTSGKRSPVVPAIPAAGESGLANYDIVFWFGLFAPKGTPIPIVQKLHQAAIKALAVPAVRDRLAQEGMEAQPSASPAAFQEMIRRDFPFWENLVRQSGAVID